MLSWIKSYSVVDCSDLVRPTQLAVLLAVFGTQLVWNLPKKQDHDEKNQSAIFCYICVIVRMLTILSSVTSDWRRGAAQIRVDTASWRPGSSSLWGRSQNSIQTGYGQNHSEIVHRITSTFVKICLCALMYKWALMWISNFSFELL